MKAANAIGVFVTLLLFTACSTTYQPSGFTGGFEETVLAPDVVRVVFAGNGYTSRQKTQDLALLRAAELAKKAGYKYFILLNEETSSTTQSFTTAGTAYTTGSVQSYGQYATYSGQIVNYPGQTITFNKPETGILVKFLNEKPAGRLVFDADFLIQTLAEKYRIKLG